MRRAVARGRMFPQSFSTGGDMNLQFQEISWNDNGLMYVIFQNNGDTLRWYPKWKDVVEVFDSALATEYGLNQGKLNEYLLFACLKLLTRYLLISAETKGTLSQSQLLRFNQLAEELQTELMKTP